MGIPNTQQEDEARRVYDLWWDSYLKGDEEAFASVVDEEMTLYGTAESELYFNKSAVVQFMRNTTDQIVGKMEMRNRDVRVGSIGSLVRVDEFNDLYVNIHGTWTFYSKARVSAFLRQRDLQWKVYHAHCSFPDHRTEEGETLAPDLIQQENLQLREAVKRRTVELEHQKRELEVEACLERVRAIAMSMKTPADMLDVCHTISDQLQLLGVEHIRNVQTAIFNDPKGTYLNYEYFTQYRTTSILEIVTELHPAVVQFAALIRNARDAYVTTSFSGRELKDWIEYRKRTNQNADPMLEQTTSVHYYFYSIGPGALGLSTYAPICDEHLNAFKRFRNVFDLAYQRFIDIEKAEAQAREAKIEAALERVRGRTMAMQRSDELIETSRVLFEQLRQLGEVGDQVSIGIFHEDEGTLELYATIEGLAWQNVARCAYADHEVVLGIHGAWKRQDRSFVTDLSGEALASYNAWRKQLMSVQQSPGLPFDQKRWIIHSAFFSRGLLSFSSSEPRPDELLRLLERFAGVFDLTYTRFLDLKQAEAQAREATIEAALERVRSKAMGMRTSGDLSATSGLVLTELRRLGITSVRCGVVLLSEATSQGSVYFGSYSSDGGDLTFGGSLNLTGHPSLERQYAHWLKHEDYLVTLKGDEVVAYYEWLRMEVPIPFVRGEQTRLEEHGYYLYFTEGQFYIWTRDPYTDEQLAILRRFKAVIELTFRRYLELQRAEELAQEAQIEASLERVRSRTLAMQKSEELAETAAVLFRQLMALGIEPNRLYIAIIQDESGHAEFWLTDEDGSKVSSGFATPLDANRTFAKMFAGWKEGTSSLTIDMQGDELKEYFEQLGKLKVPFKGGLSQTRRVQNIAYFSRGFIGLASPGPQPEETTALLERFAAVFNLTFTRFNDLQLAEAQAHQAHLDLIQLQTEKKRAEDALAELRETQVQLLQQEKLASLGQLTAGIAHEIKNPLNFVNNFSSVSLELLDEALEEMTAATPELNQGEAQKLLADVRTNLTKIIQHGTRADGIVKSMLQHSRGGNGRKEPIDLNALVREFTNLAFHGMRAAKQPINVDMVLDLQDPMKPVTVIAEDFSRVIINLCQNAFDAMRDKVNLGTGGSGSYLPRLTVRTRRDQGRVMVEVSDNGPGIPDTIRNKILQPFFTTKKGTQGTGLGLSITHDIVKAHGGVMSIQTNPDGGATFVVELPSDPGA